MSPLYLYNGKLLVENGALANNINCCCSTGCPIPPCTGIICTAQDLYGEIDCNRAGIHKHTITIPDEYTLPVPINITGSVDDDLLIDGQSASTTYEPGSYIDPNTGCVVAHTIGDQPGPFKDPVHGGITFPMNNRTFEVAARDTQLSLHSLNITICIDPNNTQNVCLPVLVTGCCYSGVDLYCYEKTVTVAGEPSYDCVTRICATGIPQGEDWTQVGGPFDCGCTDCAVTGNCIAYTGWKIIDQNNYVYANGGITYSGGNGLLNDLPNPFTPLFYGSAGEKNFKLQGYCSGGGEWHNLEEWDGTITLCGALDGRYPSQTLNGSWAPQGDCSKPVNENGDFVCDINGSSSSNCPSLVPGTAGDGQAWRDPQPSGAYTFTGAVDGEWTNLNNWQDSSGLSPAGSLPDSSSNVFINARLDNVPSDYDVTVNSLTINENGIVFIEITTNNLLVYGTVGYVSPCGDQEVGVQAGIINVNGNSCVFDGGVLEGTVYASNTTTYFNNNSYINSQGGVMLCGGLVGNLVGDAEFNTGSYNAGEITGDVVVFNNNTYNACCGSNYNAQVGGGCIQANDVTFNGNSYNEGVIRTTDIYGVVTFKNTSANRADGLILGEGYGTVKFYDTSKNTGTGNGIGDVGHVYFYDSAYNDGYAAGSNVTFEDNSYNDGTLEYMTTNFTDDSINGKNNTSAEVKNNELNNAQANFSVRSKNKGKSFAETTFSGSAINDTTGSVSSFGVDFEGTSSNKGSVTIAENSAIFRNSSINDTAGTVNGNASFENTSRNKGSVTGTADFTLGGCNDGGTATTFIPDPPPVC